MLWIAEYLTTKSTDAFINFASFDLNLNQVVNNLVGFTCSIDLAYGTLLKS